MSDEGVWGACARRLEEELSAQQFNTWIRPLQAVEKDGVLRLFAPNRFVVDWVRDRFLARMVELVNQAKSGVHVELLVGSQLRVAESKPVIEAVRPVTQRVGFGRLNPEFTFESHVEGKSNQLARAASKQVGENPGRAYNPLFIYGATGLGKTHLMQAAGNIMLQRRPESNVAYVRSEQFVADMVRALQHNAMNNFKKVYRSLDALLIDDIQFFVNKKGSQEEFFHTFSELLDGARQVIITADRFPKELDGIEDRLVSRFGSGLVVTIEPPELETRVAILMNKARHEGIVLPEDAAFFIAKRVRGNVRELEGALRRVMASSYFTGRVIDVELVSDSLKDLISFQEKLITIQNIQKTVAEYYKIRVSDMHAKDRSRNVARPRQMAMAMAKELTEHSLPEIGDAFGGRDHTTVLHACRKIAELKKRDSSISEDYENLTKLLTI